MDEVDRVVLSVLPHVIQVKPRSQVEVELAGRALPLAAKGVEQLDVDLGAVEHRLALGPLVGQADTVQGPDQRLFGQLPLLVTAEVLLMMQRVAHRQVNLELLEPERPEHLD